MRDRRRVSPRSTASDAPAAESIFNEMLGALVRADRPMTADEMAGAAELQPPAANVQLSIARVAGFVRALPGTSGCEPVYAPTTLGLALAGRRGARPRGR